jgi:hypothetical protein
MQAIDETWDSDSHCVMEYLRNYPDYFVSESEISRRAGGKARFQEDDRWCRHALSRLLEAGLVLTDGYGKFKIKPATNNAANGRPKKFISPQMRSILENGDKPVDLSSFT